MKKIIILGAQGTLGQELENIFSESYEVTAWDKTDLDVTSDEAPQRISEKNPDIIINAIGYNAVDPPEIDDSAKSIAYLLNSEVPEKLSKIAKNIDATFIHYSTDYVFDGEKKEGYTEDDKPNPLTHYGKSKYEGEQKIQNVGGKYYLIRLSRLFGTKGISESSKKSFVEIMRGEIDKSELMVKNEEFSCPTYAPDLAKLTKYIIENEKPWGIYHGANSGSCTWYGWAQEIFKDLEKGPKLIEGHAKDYNNPGKRPAFSELKNTKLPPQRPWQEALKEFLSK